MVKKMPTWLKKIREKQVEETKSRSFEILILRIEKAKNKYSPAKIMDLWEEVERLNLNDLENLKKSLSSEALDFLENIILK